MMIIPLTLLSTSTLLASAWRPSFQRDPKAGVVVFATVQAKPGGALASGVRIACDPERPYAL